MSYVPDHFGFMCLIILYSSTKNLYCNIATTKTQDYPLCGSLGPDLHLAPVAWQAGGD